MKKAILSVILVAAGVGSFAQQKTGKPVAKTITAKPKTTIAPAKSVLKNASDSFSYALGLSMSSFYKQQGVTSINNQLLLTALNDVKAGKPKLNEMQANSCIMNYMQQMRSAKASPNKKAGQAFLAENKKKPGVITLPSGLQYQIIKEGNGPKPAATDKVKVHYHGTLLDGTVFDSSVDRGEPIELSVSGVIRGWIEALQLMPVGSKWKLFIPSDLAYGDQQAGQQIAPGSTLIFDVELLEIVK